MTGGKLEGQMYKKNETMSIEKLVMKNCAHFDTACRNNRGKILVTLIVKTPILDLPL